MHRTDTRTQLHREWPPASQKIGQRRRAATIAALICVMLMMAVGPSAAQLGPANCGPLANAYGPFDYRTTRGNELNLVESAHFTPEIETLIRGKTGKIGSEIDYTLRAFPNHHRALLSMMRLGERLNTLKVPGANYEVECYFVRAITFRPDDTTARMLFANFLARAKRPDEALAQLGEAGRLAADNPFTHFNLGLQYLELQRFELALTHAHRAAALGFTRPELKDRLTSLGHWRELATSNLGATDQPGAAARPTQPASAGSP